MSYDALVLERALRRLETRRTERELAYDRRVRAMYERFPRLSAIEQELTACGVQIVQSAMNASVNHAHVLAQIRLKTDGLRAERRAILRENGYPENHLDEQYCCALCKDTGYTDSDPCTCLLELYRNEQYQELKEIFTQDSGRFSEFSPLRYSDQKGESSLSPRGYMQVVLEKLEKYANSFSSDSPNLLLRGPSGSGKTFFAACIAKTAVERFFSVLYRSAFTLEKAFEEVRFSRNETGAQEELTRLIRCDLLVIDGLGTEMTTAYTQSALFDLLNRRIAEKRPTILATSLNTDDLSARYGTHISARLQSDFVLVPLLPPDPSTKKVRGLQEL